MKHSQTYHIWQNRSVLQDPHIASYIETTTHVTAFEMALATSYSTLFAFGGLGNLYVIVAVTYMLIRSEVDHHRACTNVVVYVLALSTADFCVLAFLPLIVVTLIKRDWPFGKLACQLYMSSECLTKLLSTLILTLLSFDRYIAVCHPISGRKYRTVRISACAVLVSSSIPLAFLVLVFQNTILMVHERSVFVIMNLTESAVLIKVSAMVTKQCSMDLKPMLQNVFTYGALTCGYLLPGVSICVIYTLIFHTLRAQSQKFRNNRAILRKTSLSILRVIAFYFLCWTPF